MGQKKIFYKLFAKGKIASILDKMLFITPEDDMLLLVSARYARWENAYHTHGLDRFLLHEGHEIAAAVLFLIKNFDETSLANC